MTAQNFDYFVYYEDYLWTHVDFGNLQTAIRNDIKAHARDFKGRKVLKGLTFNSAVNFEVTVDPGTAIDPNGQVLSITAAQQATFQGPSGGQGRWSLLVARPTTSFINQIDEPLNPSNQVPLNERQTTELVVLDGTLGASAYPSVNSNDVILFGVKIGASDSAISLSNIDYISSDRFRPTDLLSGLKAPYDAIVGPESQIQSTHASINNVMADADIANIKKILVDASYSVDSPETIDQDDKEICFSPGAVISKGSSATGLIVTGNRVTIDKGKFSGFNGGSDIAIAFEGETGLCFGTRFQDCDVEILDASTNGTSIVGTQTEV